MIITVPKLALEDTIRFVRELRALPEEPEFVFDFGRCSWFPPFSMLYLASEIRLFVRSRPQSKCKVANFQQHAYAGHMGFFRAFGLEWGRKPGEASGSSTYIPITNLDFGSVTAEAGRRCIPEGKVLEEKADELGRVLVQLDSGPLVDTLRYTLREMMRNAVEHSRSDSFAYCAQYWPTRDRVEVGMIDHGVGVRQSLGRNPEIHAETDKDAVSLALMPGVSGNANRSSRSQDPWQNTGYGLFMTSQVCARGGSFFVCSGTAGVLVKGSECTYSETQHSGTAIRMELHPSRIGELSQSLSRLADEGHKIARDTKGAFKDSASLASRMLSSGFRSDAS